MDWIRVVIACCEASFPNPSFCISDKESVRCEEEEEEEKELEW
jgi:hypothetical protein